MKSEEYLRHYDTFANWKNSLYYYPKQFLRMYINNEFIFMYHQSRDTNKFIIKYFICG